MDRQYLYEAAPSYNHHSHNSAFPQLHIQQDEGFPEPNMTNIDPMLQSISPAAQLLSQWTPPQQVQRYLKDPHKTALFNLGPPLQTMQHDQMMRPVAPLPPASQRHGSPCSYHEPSSVCSSALSPAGDSDFYYENVPSTPPDLPAISPFPAPTRLDAWSSQGQMYHHLAGMGETLAMDTGVNPLEVNPTQDINFGFFENENADLNYNLLSRNFSLQSHSSHNDIDFPGSSLQHDYIRRVPSPEDMRPETRDEIRIPEHGSIYPDPVDNPDDTSDAEGASMLPRKKEDSDDSDYKPAKRASHKRMASAQGRRGNKTAKSGNSRTDEQPSVKRPRTGANSSTMPKMIASSATKGNLSCPDCRQTNFKDETGLQNHIKKQHTRPFSCVFAFAGCDATFASKNEWKRHVSSQHLLLHYWLCQQDSCEKTVNGAAGSHSRSHTGRGQAAGVAPRLPNGAIFNRKDLFTQHIRRMHTPPNVKKATKQQKKSGPPTVNGVNLTDWEDHLRILQRDAQKTRCDLPNHMWCPVPECSQEFHGQEAWDQRMEHVARHMEQASLGREGKVVFGGDGDMSLMQWATRVDVGVVKREDGQWMLNNPLKPTSKTVASAAVHDEEEDAEGEDEDE